MKRRINTEAIVIKKRELLNKDVLVTLFTIETGKITAIAKGARTLTSRRSPHVQTGNLLNVILYNKGDIYYLQETSLISGFSQIKSESPKMSLTYFFLHIIDKLAPEGQKEPDVYALIKRFLIDLSKSSVKSIEDIEIYLNRLLIALGYSTTHLPLSQLRLQIEELTGEKLQLFII